MSADTGWSKQILFPDYKFSGRVSESILTALGPLTIHQRVRANRLLMVLGRFKKITKNFLFLFMKTNNSTTHRREILINQYSISTRLFFTELSLCLPPPILRR